MTGIFLKKLNNLKDKDRLRSLSLPSGIDLTSNDYLGMASHPALRAAAMEFFQNGGDIGAAGSRLLRGHTQAHAELEHYAAAFFGAPKALYFSSGFQANGAIFQALADRNDTIIFDSLIHASAREAIQNSPAQHVRVTHSDLDQFEAALKKAQEKRSGQNWIAVESVYSMDGDTAPLAALFDMAKRYDAILIVDEAHSTGVYGQGGRGLAHGLYCDWPDNLIVLHTCGKAIGVAGGLVCASADIVHTLINTARGFIYSTAPMPLQAHLVQKSLELLAGEEGEIRRSALLMLCEKARSLFGGAGTPIVPIILGEDALAVKVARHLQGVGYDIRAIRPPTVPEGSARLRLSLSATLMPVTLDDFAGALEPLLRNKAA